MKNNTRTLCSFRLFYSLLPSEVMPNVLQFFISSVKAVFKSLSGICYKRWLCSCGVTFSGANTCLNLCGSVNFP